MNTTIKMTEQEHDLINDLKDKLWIGITYEQIYEYKVRPVPNMAKYLFIDIGDEYCLYSTSHDVAKQVEAFPINVRKKSSMKSLSLRNPPKIRTKLEEVSFPRKINTCSIVRTLHKIEGHNDNFLFECDDGILFSFDDGINMLVASSDNPLDMIYTFDDVYIKEHLRSGSLIKI